MNLQMGAMMNESFQAKEGLPPDLFPEGVPTYTGHYHKPHVVENTNIQYIGSPYQGLFASLSSAYVISITLSPPPRPALPVTPLPRVVPHRNPLRTP